MKKAVIYLSLLSMVFGFMAFECSSAELTGAKLYIQQKQMAKAKEALLKEVEKNPKSDEGWFILGTLYGDEGTYDKMLDAFNHSVGISNKFEPQIKESRKYYWATSFNRGVSYFNQAAKNTKPDSMKVLFDKAADMFTVSTMCEPDSVIGYSNIAMVYINTGRVDDAITPLEKVMKVGKSADSFAMLGQIYIDKGNKAKEAFEVSKNDADKAKSQEYFEKAVKVLEAGRIKFPDNSEILLRVSNAYIGANKMDVAMAAFKAGVEKEPANKYYRYNYGVVLLNGKQFEEASKQFGEAVKLDSEYANAIYNLAVTYVRWGTSIRDDADKSGAAADEAAIKDKFTLALPHLEKYLKINPKEPALWELLGKVYANLGMKDKSDDAFKKADQYR